MTLLSGTNIIGILIIAGSVAVLGSLALLASYRLKRLVPFFSEDPGYNVTQSLLAIASGKFTGVGLGDGLYKFGHLPEAHTDFVFSLVGEELGLLGVTCLILLYGIVIWRLLSLSFLALKNQHLFNSMLVFGIALWLFFQIFVHIASGMNLLPPKGLVLPFFSHGGSFILVYFIALGMVLNLEQKVRQVNPQTTPKKTAKQTRK